MADAAPKLLVIGGSGLVGQALLGGLANSNSYNTHALLRRPVNVGPSIETHLAEADSWPSVIAAIAPDVMLCALGTTIKAAGSQSAFHAIDFDLLVSSARAARRAGARQIIFVSSVGASITSRGFYLRTKGQGEAAIGALGFDRVDIMRPGLLLGARQGALRLGERIGMALAPLTNALTPGAFDQYRAIHSDDVARAMITLIGAENGGIHAHHNREMLALAHSV
jgi:uncharacterized protein YbjT (DUF2867 family)